MADQHDDLHAEQTAGFKVGEKKTLDEYQNLGEQLDLGYTGPTSQQLADAARQTRKMKP